MADQESIHVSELDYILCVRLSDRASIDDSGSRSNFWTAVVFQPISNQLHCFLGLISTRDLSRVLSPNWLVGDNHVFPARFVESRLDRAQLVKYDVGGLLVLLLLEVLADAVDQA